MSTAKGSREKGGRTSRDENGRLTEARQAMAFFWREAAFKKRHYMWQLVWIVYDLMWALSIGFLGTGIATVSNADLDTSRLVLYLLVGSFLWTYLSSVFAIVSWAIVWERWEGTIEYTFMAPVKRLTHLLGLALFSIPFGVVRLIIVFAICAPIFRLDLAGANLVTAGFLIAVSSLPFIGLGMLVAVFPLLDQQNGDKAPHFAEAIIMMVSGIYYPIATLPLWLQGVARLSPATYALEGTRAAILEGASIAAVWRYTWPLLVLAAVLIPLGNWVFIQAERHAKQTGKLKREG